MRKETIYSVTIDKENQITFKVEKHADKEKTDHFEIWFMVFAGVMVIALFLFPLLLLH